MPGTIDELAEKLAEKLLRELCTPDGEHEPLTRSENIATRKDGSVISKEDLQNTIKQALAEAEYNAAWDEDTISAFEQSDPYDSIKRTARNPRVKKEPVLDPDENDDAEFPSGSDYSDPESEEEEEIETPADTAQAVTALEQAAEASPSQTAAEPSKPTWEQILEELTSTLLPFFETNSITEANLKSAIARNLEEFYGGQPTGIPTEDLITTLTEIGIEKLQQSPASLAATAAEPAQSNPNQSPETQTNSEQVPQTTQRALEFLQTVKQKLLHELDIPLKTEDTALRDHFLEQLILTKFISDSAAFGKGIDVFIATHGNNILAVVNENTRKINSAIEALATTVLQSYLREADEYTVHQDRRITLEDGSSISKDTIITAMSTLVPTGMRIDLSTIVWSESTPDSLANRIIDRALGKERKEEPAQTTNITKKTKGPPRTAEQRVSEWRSKLKTQQTSPLGKHVFTAVRAPEFIRSENLVEAAADRLLRRLLEQNHCSPEQIRKFLEDHSDSSYLWLIPLADGRRVSRFALFKIIDEVFLSYSTSSKNPSFDDLVAQKHDQLIQDASLQANAELSLRLRRSPITASWQQLVSLITAANWEAVSDTSTSPAVDKFRIPLVVLSLKLQPNPSLCFALSRCCEEKEGLWTTEKLTATLKKWLKINFDLLPEEIRIPFARTQIWIDSVSILAGNPYNWHFAFRVPRYSEGEIWKQELQQACSLLSYCIMGNQEGADICMRKGPPITTWGSLPELTTKTAIASRLPFQAWLDETMQHRMRYLESDFQGKYAQGSRPTKEQFRTAILWVLGNLYGPCYNMESDRLRLTGWFKETYTAVTRRAFALANPQASTTAIPTQLAEDIFQAYLANYLTDPVMISQALAIGEIYFAADDTRLKKQAILPAILSLCHELNIKTKRWELSHWEAFANQHDEQITRKVFELSSTTNINAVNTLGNTNMPTAAARSTGAFPPAGVDEITWALMQALSTPATVRPDSNTDPYTEIEMENPKEIKFSEWLENAALERERFAQSDWEGEDACPALPNSPEFAFAISHVFKKNGWVSYENGLYDKKQLELWHKESHEAVRKIAFSITTCLAHTLFIEHNERVKKSDIVESILQTLRNHTELSILDWDENLWLTFSLQYDLMATAIAKQMVGDKEKRPAAKLESLDERAMRLFQEGDTEGLTLSEIRAAIDIVAQSFGIPPENLGPTFDDEIIIEASQHRKKSTANSTAQVLTNLAADREANANHPPRSEQFGAIYRNPLGSGAPVKEVDLEDHSRRSRPGNHKGAPAS